MLWLYYAICTFIYQILAPIQHLPLLMTIKNGISCTEIKTDFTDDRSYWIGGSTNHDNFTLIDFSMYRTDNLGNNEMCNLSHK